MPTLKPEDHGAMEPAVISVAGTLRSLGAACDCGHVKCWSRIARIALAAMETAAGDRPATMVSYDPASLILARMAALRIVAGRSPESSDAGVLAEAFELLTRPILDEIYQS